MNFIPILIPRELLLEHLKVVAMEHANLIKALGDRPEELEDPRRTEKHSFYVLVQNNNNAVKLDINNLQNLPLSTLNELNKALLGVQEMNDAELTSIFNS